MRLYLPSHHQSQLAFRIRKQSVWLRASRRFNSSNSRIPRQKPSKSPSTLKHRVWSRLGPLVRLFELYSRVQIRRPYLTQLCSMPIIYCLGDLSAQMIGKDAYDPHRTLRSVIVGAAISIPSYKWFMFLGSQFNYASAVLSTGTKVVVNQLSYGPLFNVYFFAFHALLSGDGMMGAIERVKDTVPTSIPKSFLYWPVVTAFSFTYVKPQSRSVVTGLFAVFWQSYLSWLNNRAEKDERNDTTMLVPVTMSQ